MPPYRPLIAPLHQSRYRRCRGRGRD